MNAAPNLSTDRFELRPPGPGDLAALVTLVDHDETHRFLGPSRADPASQFDRLLRNAGGWALYGYGTFAVREKGKNDLIASCGVFHSMRGFGKEMDDVPEAGWIVRHDWWSRGVATEVMTAVLDWFDRTHGPRRVVCMIERGNVASERIAERFGFARYGRQRLEDEAVVNLFERVINTPSP